MAYMDQEQKAKIAAALKSVVPTGWKYSLSVRHHSTIVMTITAAPFDLIRAFKPSEYFNPETAKKIDVNPYHYREWIEDEAVADVIEKIMDALNLDNYDKSESQSDYFNKGHYVSLHIGRWNKPFQVTGVLASVAA